MLKISNLSKSRHGVYYLRFHRGKSQRRISLRTKDYTRARDLAIFLFRMSTEPDKFDLTNIREALSIRGPNGVSLTADTLGELEAALGSPLISHYLGTSAQSSPNTTKEPDSAFVGPLLPVAGPSLVQNSSSESPQKIGNLADGASNLRERMLSAEIHKPQIKTKIVSTHTALIQFAKDEYGKAAFPIHDGVRPDKYAREKISVASQLARMINPDKPEEVEINSIGPSEAQRFFEQFYDRTEFKHPSKPEKPYSSEHVKKQLSALKVMFKIAIRKKLYIADKENPFDSVEIDFHKLTTKRQSYQAFNSADIEQIFDNVLYAQYASSPLHKWIPLIMLAVGASTNEIAALETQNVYQRDGIWLIDLVDIDFAKNTKRVRKVPVPDLLLKGGFDSYVQLRKAENKQQLFDVSLNSASGPQADVGEKFNKYLDSLLIHHPKRLYSFRHTLISEMSATGINDACAKAIVGHTDLYGFAFSRVGMINYQTGRSPSVRLLKIILDHIAKRWTIPFLGIEATLNEENFESALLSVLNRETALPGAYADETKEQP